MDHPKILEMFFEEQHRKWRKKAYEFLQLTCQCSPRHSDYGEWLKRRATEKKPPTRSGKGRNN